MLNPELDDSISGFFLLYLQCEIKEREVMLDFDSDLETNVDGVVYLHRHKDTVMKFLKANYKVGPEINFEKSFELLPPDPKEPERILVNVLTDWIEARHTIRAVANKRFRFNKVKQMYFIKCKNLVKCVGLPKYAIRISFTCNDSIQIINDAPDDIKEYSLTHNKNLKSCKLPKKVRTLTYEGNKNTLSKEELNQCQYDNYIH